MGNGPSLNEVDIGKLKSSGVHTFGLNRAFLAYEKWDFYPTYYGMFDAKRVYQCHEGIDMLKDKEQTKRLFIRNDKKVYKKYKGKMKKITFCESPTLHWLDKPSEFNSYRYPSGEEVMPKFPSPVGTSSITAIQFLYGMGYDNIGLVGIDCNYKSEKDKSIQNHFIEGYITDKPSMISAGNNLVNWETMVKQIKDVGKLNLYCCSEKSRLVGICDFMDVEEFYKL